eukprot:6470753-Amphidinium_carterae.3
MVAEHGWEIVESEYTELALLRWRHILASCPRIRYRQRLFAQLGQHLDRNIDKNLRDRLRLTFAQRG